MKINDHISRLQLEYKDIFTTIYTIKTPEGVLVFDAASYPQDITVHLRAHLEAEGIAKEEVRGVFISHKHSDHAGGLPAFAAEYPNAKIYSRSEVIREEYPGRVICLEDGQALFGGLEIVTIPGHTADSAGVLDRRSMILITGDSLQLIGIFGSGNWCANIYFPALYLQALGKLETMGIRRILTAHDYHPCGWDYPDQQAIALALQSCREPLEAIRQLILQYPEEDDAAIAARFNKPTLPKLGTHVVTHVRRELL